MKGAEAVWSWVPSADDEAFIVWVRLEGGKRVCLPSGGADFQGMEGESALDIIDRFCMVQDAR